MPEQFEGKEKFVSEEQVIEALKTRGLEDESARELLLKWVKQLEAEADRENTARANAECGVKQALLYYKTGYPAEALEALELSRLEAWNRGDEELYNNIVDFMDQIERQSEQK